MRKEIVDRAIVVSRTRANRCVAPKIRRAVGRFSRRGDRRSAWWRRTRPRGRVIVRAPRPVGPVGTETTLMLADTLRVAVFIVYVVLTVSRFRTGTTGDAWLLLLAVLGANALIAAGEELYWRRRLRRYVETLRALDPLHLTRVIQNKWQSDVSRLLTQQLAAEGEPEIGGIVERYPFSRRDRRRNTVAYWTTVAAAAVAALWPLFDSSAPRLMRATSLGLAVLFAATLPFLRRRERRLATVIEIPYQTLINLYLRECAATGRRLTMAWREPTRPSKGVV